MAISTSIDFGVTRDDIITTALEILGILEEGEAANANQITTMARMLNMLVKSWQAENTNLFAVQRVHLFLEKAVSSYALSNASTSSHWTTIYRSYRLSVAAAAASLTVTVADTNGITNGARIGIALDSGAMHWTTVNGVPTATVVTLATALPSAAALDSYVFNYIDKAQRPMVILNATVRDTDNNDMPVNIISRSEYHETSNKTLVGTVNEIYYDPQIGVGSLFVWPAPEHSRHVLVLRVQKTLADMDIATDNPEYPQEWHLALCYGLASVAIPIYRVPVSIGAKIEREAARLYERASTFDGELTSVYLQPHPKY